ncbi:UNVERIFIED_CONTAM: hypothetical protein NCL1_19103 [Trichonephila clavipes]
MDFPGKQSSDLDHILWSDVEECEEYCYKVVYMSIQFSLNKLIFIKIVELNWFSYYEEIIYKKPFSNFGNIMFFEFLSTYHIDKAPS